MKPFIPSWLNQAGLSQAEFRVYCSLCCRADNKTGIAWPQAETIAKDCIMARNTVWKSLRTLEEKNLIKRSGKPFGGSTRYQILTPPISANGIPIEIPISANEMPIESLPIVANETPPIGANEILQSAQMDSQEGNPKKVIQGRVSNNSITELAETIYRAYPRKVSKPSAIRAITRAINKHGYDFLIERTTAYATAIQWKEREFIPHPDTWFNNERFNDDPREWNQPTNGHSLKPHPTVNVVHRRKRPQES